MWDQWPAVFGFVAMCAAALCSVFEPRIYIYWLITAGCVLTPIAILLSYWFIGSRFPIDQSVAGALDFEAAPKSTLSTLPSRAPIYLALIAAVISLCANPVFRLTARPPINKACDPPVVAPGDKVRIYVDNSIRSVDGIWGGRASAVVINHEEIELRRVSSKHHIPRESIRVDGDAPTTRVPKTYVDVEIPNHPGLAGSTLELAIELKVTCPIRRRQRSFQYEEFQLSDNRSIEIGTPTEARGDYWTQLVSAIVGVCLTGFASAAALHRNSRIAKSMPRPEVLLDEVQEVG